MREGGRGDRGRVQRGGGHATLRGVLPGLGGGGVAVEEKAVRGARWTMLSYASSKAMTVVTTIVLAHLLVPSDFGLVALASLAIGFLGLVNDLGMWGALVVRQDFDKRAQGTVFTIMLVSRALLTVLAVGAAQFADEVFHTTGLDAVLSVLSVTIFIGSVTWFYDAILHRELEFPRRFAAQLADTVTYTVVTLSLAAVGAGVWSLVIGQIAGLLVHTVMVVVLAPYWVRPRFNRKAAREASSAGRGFVVQGGVAFLNQNVDSLAIGRVLGRARLVLLDGVSAGPATDHGDRRSRGAGQLSGIRADAPPGRGAGAVVPLHPASGRDRGLPAGGAPERHGGPVHPDAVGRPLARHDRTAVGARHLGRRTPRADEHRLAAERRRAGQPDGQHRRRVSGPAGSRRVPRGPPLRAHGSGVGDARRPHPLAAGARVPRVQASRRRARGSVAGAAGDRHREPAGVGRGETRGRRDGQRAPRSSP